MICHFYWFAFIYSWTKTNDLSQTNSSIIQTHWKQQNCGMQWCNCYLTRTWHLNVNNTTELWHNSSVPALCLVILGLYKNHIVTRSGERSCGKDCDKLGLWSLLLMMSAYFIPHPTMIHLQFLWYPLAWSFFLPGWGMSIGWVWLWALVAVNNIYAYTAAPFMETYW